MTITKSYLHYLFASLRCLLAALLLIVTSCCVHVSASGEKVMLVKGVKIDVERLPDLNVPRSGHSMLCLNGEYVVFGGHTTGFVPTNTVEYYHDGNWHLLHMIYTHDGCMTIPLKSGKVMLAGGYEKHLGIGQTFVAELYDPVAHSFQAFGCLDYKRAMSTGVEMDSGKVIISGNWYHDDAIEQFDGHNKFSFVKHVTTFRACPFVLRVSKDNAVIFGGLDYKGNDLYGKVTVDQLRGDTIHVPLFQHWKPLGFCEQTMHSDSWFIGDEEKGQYSYLIPVENREGQKALALLVDTTFTLLPTTKPIPTHSQYGAIIYESPLVIDRDIKRAYLVGHVMGRCYCVGIDYGIRPAAVTVFRTDSIASSRILTLTPEGDILMTGGIKDDNYNPYSTAYLLRVKHHPDGQTKNSSSDIWLWAGTLGGILVLVLGLLLWVKRKKTTMPIPVEAEETEQQAKPSNKELVDIICKLMDDQQVYLNTDLNLASLSAMVHTNSRYVSDCIKKERGCSFAQFVNGYRINHAKQLLQNNHDEKLASVAIQSGFANETSFFRTFKAMTGLTPREWLSAQRSR